MKYLILLSLLIVGCTHKPEITNEKILNLNIGTKITSFDPAIVSDSANSTELGRVYEGLYEYHHLKRPVELIPSLAESMPVIREDGLVYTINIKKGVFFHNSPAFPNGIGRELEAKDFVFSIMRVADPKNISPVWWVYDTKIKGLNEWRVSQEDTKITNYDVQIEGLKAISKYTLQITLTRKIPQFIYFLAMPSSFAVSREAVEYYKHQFSIYPVGTGPFILPVHNHHTRIEYIRNPNYREVYYPSEASEEFIKLGYLEDSGKRLPLLDKIIVRITTEEQSKWLMFKRGKSDIASIPKDSFTSTLNTSKELSKEFKEKGVKIALNPSLDIFYYNFNISQDLFKNIKLRQAMSLAYNPQEAINFFFNGLGTVAHGIIPHNLEGYNPNFKNPYVGDGSKESIIKAKKLLEEAGFPNGKSLPEITLDITAGTTPRQMGEYFAKRMSLLGIKIIVVENNWSTLLAKIKKNEYMMTSMGWSADYPDAENFLQLIYGPHKVPGSNTSNYDNLEYNREFEVVSNMIPSPKRSEIYKKLNEKYSLEVPWIGLSHRYSVALYHGWVKNYTASEFNIGSAKYLNVDNNIKKSSL